MIGLIIKLIQSDEWIGISDEVDIVKGKYAIPRGWKDFKKQAKRIIKR